MFLRRGSRHFLISIHAPREGGDRKSIVGRNLTIISIHAPREGGGVIEWPLCLPGLAVQSTPPARGATSLLPHFSVK